MKSKELRDNFLGFFRQRGHRIVSSSSLIPEDESVLFTTAGMQQFKPYYLGKESPLGRNVASCQKCFRTSDIDEVGDKRHLTFFEMLGNFSFGGYFKEKAIALAFEYLTSFLHFPVSELRVTVFEGDEKTPRDEQSAEVWKKFGFSEEKGNLKFCSREDNFWGPTGKEGPCGPTTEIYYRDIEIWNLVFNEYYRDKNGLFTPLEQKGVDTGMGLERLTMAVQKKSNVFETDLFYPIIRQLKKSGFETAGRGERIIADHIKGAVFLISEGVFPSNVGRGYVLRRLLRRAIRYANILKLPEMSLISAAKETIGIYKDVYPTLLSRNADILTVIQEEREKFEKTLKRGLKELELKIEEAQKQGVKRISGKTAFDLFQSYGFPLEITEEIAKERGFSVEKEGFEREFKRHQEISRRGAERKFGGIGREAGIEERKLHTATHLLQAALRKVLGDKVRQMGSDINSERLRFDFSFPRKMTQEEIKKVEALVNQKIKEDIEVKREVMSYEEAVNSGALAFFKEKYPQEVSVYTIGDFSKEICAGPHVRRTSELGHFKIVKEESSGAGVRRIKAILTK